MSYVYKNITGSTATEIILDPTYVYNSMLLCNIHASDRVSIDLYITKKVDTETTTIVAHEIEGVKQYMTVPNTEINSKSKANEDGRKLNNSYDAVETTTYTYYILKSLVLPYSGVLVLDKEELTYDTSYRLYIKLNASDSAVDLKISQGELRNLNTPIQNPGGGGIGY